MKTTFKVFVFLLLTGNLLHSQDKSKIGPVGFIRMVNAVASGTGQLSLMIDGKNVRPKGYALGNVTGGIGRSAGSRKIVIKREGVEDGVTTVNLENDQTVTLIPFAEKVPASDTKPAYFTMKILRLKQRAPETGRTVTFASVSANPELKAEVQGEDGKWASVFVKRLTIGEVPLNYSQGYAPARVNGLPIKQIPIGGDGNYVIVLYDDAEGKVQSLYFRDFKFLSAD